MQKSILFDIISSFDRKEHKYIQKWLQSPIHNKREGVALLFQLMTKSKGKELSKEQAYAALYPKTNYDDARMRQVMYFLQKELEDYLVYQAVKADSLFPSRILLNVYQKKKMLKPFERTLKKANQQLEKYPYRDRHFLQTEYLFLDETYRHKSASERFQDFNLQFLSETLERHFLAEKLRIACIMQSHARIYKSTYDSGLLTSILPYIEERGWLDIPGISLYYYSYKALTQKDKVWFDRLLSDMKKWKSKLPKEEEREILFMVLNYCIAKINEGDKSYYAQALIFYRAGLDEGILMTNKQLSRFTFINIVIAAIHEKDYDWTERFIRNFSGLLDERFRESTTNLTYIRLFYIQKKYKKAMLLINETVFDDIIMGMYAKGTLIKIYYDLGQITALESFLDSFLTYLRRKELMAYHQEVYKSFALALKRIIRLTPGDTVAKEKLYQEILNKDKITEREWLLSLI